LNTPPRNPEKIFHFFHAPYTVVNNPNFYFRYAKNAKTRSMQWLDLVFLNQNTDLYQPKRHLQQFGKTHHLFSALRIRQNHCGETPAFRHGQTVGFLCQCHNPQPTTRRNQWPRIPFS
jgi:hypothetical protein